MLIRLRHIAILGLLIALSGPLYGQARNNVTQRPCPELNTIKNRLDQAIAQEQFRDALDQLSALRACDTRPEQQSFIDTKYGEVIDAIEAKRNEADSLRNEAVRTVAQLERARNDLERSLVARQQALSQAQSATTAAVNAQTKAEQALELAEQRRRTALANVYLGMVEDIGQILEANTDYDPEVVANDLSVMLTDFTYRYVDSTLSEMAGLILRLYHRDALHDIIDPAEDRELASQPMQIFDMSWSPAENLAALATSKQGVVILDQPNSNTFIQLRGPQTMANAVVWSPDGNRLAGAYDRELVIWNRNTWEPTRRPIDLPSSILVMAWDPSGERLAVGCTNGKVYLVDIRTGGIGAELTFHIDYIRDLAWSSDGKRLATASDDRKVAIWNTTTWDTLSVLRGHNDWVRTVAWHPSDTLLVTGGDDNQVIWWDTRNWQVRDVDNFESYVNQVDFDPSGDQLLVATWTGQFVLLGVDDDRRQQLTDIPPEMEIGRFSWSGDGLQVLAGGQHQAVFLYQMGNGELYFDQALDLEGGDERNLLTTDANQSIELVKWSPRGDVLAAVSTDGTLRLFDHASDPKRVRILQTDQKQITALAWSPDGNRIVTASEVGLLKIWHTGNDSLGLTIATANQPLAVDWSPDGETLAFAGSGGTIYLYNVELQQYSDQLIYHNRPVRALAWSPVNDGYLASVDDEGRVVVWNTVTGVPTLLGRHTDWGRAVAWLNGNRQLVSASDDKHTIIWSWSADRQMGVPRDTIVENSGYHLSLAISDNGNALAIGTAGGKVTFWKLDEPDGPLKIGELLYTDQMVSSLSWRPGGSLLGMNAPKGIPRTILTGLLRAEFGDWEIDRTEGSRKQRTRLPIFSVEDYGNTFTWQPEHANFALIEGDQRAVIRRNLLNEDVQPILEAVEGIELSDLLWSPHGRRLAARTMDNHLQVWEILKGRGPRIYRLVYPEENADYINDWVWSDNGALLAAISNKGALFVWDLKVDSLPVHTFYSDKEEWLIEVTQLFFMPNERDGLVLVTSDKIRQWDFADSTDEVGVFDERFSFGDAFWFGQHHPLGNGKWLFVPNLYYGSSFDDYQLTAPMEITITNSGTFPLRKPFDDLLGVNAHAVSPDGTLFAGAPVQEKTQEAPLVIWDYRTGQPKGELNAVRELELIDLAISPDNRLIAISGNERNNYYEPVVQLWDWQREALLFSYPNVGESVSFSPDGSYLVTRTGGYEAHFWPIDAREVIDEMRSQVEIDLLEKEMIKLFSLEEGVALSDDNLRRLRQEESPTQLAAWCEYFLERAELDFTDERRRLSFNRALSLLGRPTTGPRPADRLDPLRLQAYERVGNYWLAEEQVDSALLYLQAAYDLGGRVNKNLQAQLLLLNWLGGDQEASFAGITQMLETQTQGFLQREFTLMVSNRDPRDSAAMLQLARIIYLDSLAGFENELFASQDVAGFEPIETLVASFAPELQRDYLLLYYFKNRNNKTLSANTRRTYMENALTIFAEKESLDEQNTLRYYGFAYDLALARFQNGEFEAAMALAEDNYRRMKTLMDRTRSQLSQMNYRRKWLARIVAQQAWFYLNEKQYQAAGEVMQPLWSRDSIFTHPDLILQRGHYLVLQDSMREAIRLYRIVMEQSPPEGGIRQRIIQELLRLDYQGIREVAAYLRALEELERWEDEQADLGGLRDDAYSESRYSAAIGYNETLNRKGENILPQLEVLYRGNVIAERVYREEKEQIARDYGNFSFLALLDRRFTEAEAAALRSAELADLDWVKTNLGHSYLFQGRWEEAKAVYTAIGGLPDDSTNEASSLGELLLQDFVLLREAGVWNEDVPRAAAMLLGVENLSAEDAVKYGPPQ